jgi:uncharacterized membrane protein YeaQ/YmgE (transglycosylase-associated protein family)
MIQGLIIVIVVGLIAGWLAGRIWKGKGFGFIGNIIVGVLGSFIGGYVFNFLGISFYGWIGATVAAVAGSLILLALINFIKK